MTKGGRGAKTIVYVSRPASVLGIGKTALDLSFLLQCWHGTYYVAECFIETHTKRHITKRQKPKTARCSKRHKLKAAFVIKIFKDA
jgi:hypothetical protein